MHWLYRLRLPLIQNGMVPARSTATAIIISCSGNRMYCVHSKYSRAELEASKGQNAHIDLLLNHGDNGRKVTSSEGRQKLG